MAEQRLESTRRSRRRAPSTAQALPPQAASTSRKAPRRSEQRAEPAVPVLYIAGIGRSGSTLLGRGLGSVDGLVFLGEIMHLFGRGMQRNERCACGARLRTCEVWGAVLEDLESSGLCPDPSAAEGLRRRFTEGPALLAPFLPWAPARVRSELGALRRLLGATYRSLHRGIGCRVIVDSSKSPAYARILLGTPGVRVHVVHLVRDARGVVFSLAKRTKRPGTSVASELLDQRTAPAASALWAGAHLLTETLEPRAAGYVRVRYDDFVAAPASEVARVLRSLGLAEGQDGKGGLRSLAHPSGGKLRLATHHVLAGHPVRSRIGDVELAEDLEWRRSLAPPKRLLVTALTFPLLARYGYLTNGSGPAAGE